MRLLLWLPLPVKSVLNKSKGSHQGLFTVEVSSPAVVNSQDSLCSGHTACSAGSVLLSSYLVSIFAAGQSVVWCHCSPYLPPQIRKIGKICPQWNFTLLLAHGNRHWINHSVCVCVSRWIIETLEALCIPPIWAQDTHFQDGNSLPL